MTYIILLSVILVALKIFGIINISWLLALIPVIIVFYIEVIIYIFFFIIFILTLLHK